MMKRQRPYGNSFRGSRTLLVLLLLVISILLASGCANRSAGKTESIYPDYAVCAAAAVSSVSVEAESISPNRILLELQNFGDAILLDGTFVLYDTDGKPVYETSAADGSIHICRDTLCAGLYFGNRTGTLKAGRYRLALRIVERAGDGSVEPAGFVVCELTLPKSTASGVSGKTMETGILYGDGTTDCDTINLLLSEIRGNGCTASFRNLSAETAYISGDFVLYLRSGEDCVPVPYAIPVAEVGYGLTVLPCEGGVERKEIIDWSTVYGELDPGTYLLVYRVGGTELVTAENSTYLSAEFEITG